MDARAADGLRAFSAAHLRASRCQAVAARHAHGFRSPEPSGDVHPVAPTAPTGEPGPDPGTACSVAPPCDISGCANDPNIAMAAAVTTTTATTQDRL